MSGYYEKLRTVYEHHLDERIKGKVYNFPSPKYIVPPLLSTNRTNSVTSPKSSSGQFFPVPGILKSPKGDPNKLQQQLSKAVTFKVYNAIKMHDIQKMRYAKEYELREFQKERSKSRGKQNVQLPPSLKILNSQSSSLKELVGNDNITQQQQQHFQGPLISQISHQQLTTKSNQISSIMEFDQLDQQSKSKPRLNNHKRDSTKSHIKDVPSNISQLVAMELSKLKSAESHRELKGVRNPILVEIGDSSSEQIDIEALGEVRLNSEDSSQLLTQRIGMDMQKSEPEFIDQALQTSHNRHGSSISKSLNSTKEVLLKRFIDRNKELLFQPKISTSHSRSSMSRDLITKVEDLQRFNLQKLAAKRQFSFDIIQEIYDKHRLQQTFELLRQNLRYLNSHELKLTKIHRKSTLKNFIKVWKQSLHVQQFDQQNYVKAQEFHQAQLKIRAKYLIFRWKKAIKEEQRWLVNIIEHLRKSKLRRHYELMKMYVKFNKVKKWRQVNWQRKFIEAAKREVEQKGEYLRWHEERLKSKVFQKLRFVTMKRRENKIKVEYIKEYMSERAKTRVMAELKCNKEYIKSIKSDKLLMKAAVHDEEFFEIVIERKSQIEQNVRKGKSVGFQQWNSFNVKLAD